ncbi:phosphatidylserine/phosphatidylglycerophosphate/cardiolipin synthase family protein [Burkholderia multivorans]|uniref:phosphatidylserine/phosphatidylglycerophosphate/ cardiolipin synthase family protein n=1 Tax=Burkholderia multivorans TaxID=87883 RepID=UPI000A728737|nr:phosphatidylserine/phosphatidylglycerophosphate/cardiolipin synthase family protein [Burkholderia multivorans]
MVIQCSAGHDGAVNSKIWGGGLQFGLPGLGASPGALKYRREAAGWHNATLHSNVLSRDIGSEGPMYFDPEALHVQLGRLIESMPDLYAPVTADTSMWLGRAIALVEASGAVSDAAALRTASHYLDSVLRDTHAAMIATILHTALARAELKVSMSTRGAFIPVGASFTAIAAVSKILSAARSDVLLVDPYADVKVLTDFAVLAPEGVLVRVLSDKERAGPSLCPAAQRWVEQYALSRPLEVRLTAPFILHERLVIVDGAQVWELSRSLNDLGARSSATIVRADADTAARKAEACKAIWDDAAVPV